MVAQVPASVQRQGGWAAQAPSVGIEAGWDTQQRERSFFWRGQGRRASLTTRREEFLESACALLPPAPIARSEGSRPQRPATP